MADKPDLKLQGTFPCVLDEKSRLTVPKVLRALIPGETGSKVVVICRAKDMCLNLFPPEYFEWVLEQVKALPAGPRQRALLRFYASESMRLTMDRFGRVPVPARFQDVLEFSKNVVVVGVRSHLELWSEAARTGTQQAEREAYEKDDEWQY